MILMEVCEVCIVSVLLGTSHLSMNLIKTDLMENGVCNMQKSLSSLTDPVE